MFTARPLPTELDNTLGGHAESDATRCKPSVTWGIGRRRLARFTSGELRPIKRTEALAPPRPLPVTLPQLYPRSPLSTTLFRVQTRIPTALLRACVPAVQCRPRTLRIAANLPESADQPTRPHNQGSTGAFPAPTTRGGSRHALMELVVGDSPLAEYLEGQIRPSPR